MPACWPGGHGSISYPGGVDKNKRIGGCFHVKPNLNWVPGKGFGEKLRLQVWWWPRHLHSDRFCSIICPVSVRYGVSPPTSRHFSNSHAGVKFYSAEIGNSLLVHSYPHIVLFWVVVLERSYPVTCRFLCMPGVLWFGWMPGPTWFGCLIVLAMLFLIMYPPSI